MMQKMTLGLIFVTVLDTSRLYNIPCLKKLCKFALSEIRQISTNVDNFWQKDGNEAKIMCGTR